jgi:hypothetical protein
LFCLRSNSILVLICEFLKNELKGGKKMNTAHLLPLYNRATTGERKNEALLTQRARYAQE